MADLRANGHATRSFPLDGFFGDLLECIAEGVIAADCDGRFVLFNSSAQRILRLGPREVPGVEWMGASSCFLEDGVTPFPSEDLPLSKAIRGETVRDCVLHVRNARVPDGIWISVNGTPLRDRSGALYGGAAVFRDVTDERRRMERTLLLSTVAEQTADAVIVTDRHGVIEYVNPAVERMTGFRSDELIGNTPRVLRSGLHSTADYSAMWGTLLKGGVFRGTLVNRKKTDGELYYSEQTITPVRDASGQVSRFVSVAKDLTEVRAALDRASKLRLARSVQQRMYPAPPPSTCGFDVAGASIPADETGGDYYDYFRLTQGGLALAVGDVSGHGFDAALHMVQARTILRALVEAHVDPAAVLSRMNSLLVDELDDHRFITLILACLDAGTRKLRYASAGHTTGYVLGPDGRVKAELLSTGLPLGLFPGVSFETAAVPCVESGDLVALFTDGIAERVDDGPGYGAEGALEDIRRYRHEPAAEIVRRVCEAAREAGPGPQLDDMTMVVCKAGAAAPGADTPAD